MAAAYTLEQFEAALAGIEEKRPSKRAPTGPETGTRAAQRLSLDDTKLHAARPELVIEAIQRRPNNAENNPTHLDFVRWMAAIKAALGPKREDYYGHVLTWALEYPGNDGKYVRGVWDSIKNAELGADWIFVQCRFSDPQADFADPAYPPESFYGLDADGIRGRIEELVILKFGWPEAYQEVCDYLEMMSVIDLAEVDALIAKRAPAYEVASARERTPSATNILEALPFKWQDPTTIPRRQFLYG